MPVQPGPLTLLFPAWLPGNHRPAGPIDKLAGLEITANGRRLDWKRDPTDVFAFHVDVPAGVSSLSMQYQYLTPTDRGQGRGRSEGPPSELQSLMRTSLSDL